MTCLVKSYDLVRSFDMSNYYCIKCDIIIAVYIEYHSTNIILFPVKVFNTHYFYRLEEMKITLLFAILFLPASGTTNKVAAIRSKLCNYRTCSKCATEIRDGRFKLCRILLKMPKCCQKYIYCQTYTSIMICKLVPQNGNKN